jgi:hypothetical protein
MVSTTGRIAIGTAAVGGLMSLREWTRAWGATGAERRAALPGDDVVERPRMQSTRAIAIGADPEDVWPWLAQLGQGRGGLYSYERLENLFGCRIENLDVVIPELQDIRVGDEIRLVPPDYRADLSFEVSVAEPNRALVLRVKRTREDAFADGMAFASWAFVISPVAAGRVRLLARWRSDFEPAVVPFVTWHVVEPVHFVMERRMLRGIRDRAERLARERSAGVRSIDPPLEPVQRAATASATIAASSPTP